MEIPERRWKPWTRSAAALREELAALEAAPCFHCMLRHLLESMLRIATLAPVHAARRGGGDAEHGRLSRLLRRLHLLTLAGAAKLDALAAPIQVRGIPILCQDTCRRSRF